MNSLLIPPIPHLSLALGRPRHLTLAHLYKNPTYRDFYTREAERGSFIILDNSAHENQIGQGIESLLEIARDVKASEVVLPDHLFDSRDTVVRTVGAIEKILQYPGLLYQQSYRFMAVPQGQTRREYVQCLRAIVRTYQTARHVRPDLFPYPLTIGVSKDYESWSGGLYYVLKSYVIPIALENQCQIHMLGWGRDLWAVTRISKAFKKYLRSIDSAKPFVYGISNIRLDPTSTLIPEYPRRPSDYFDREMTTSQLEATQYNIGVFDSLTAGFNGRDFDSIRTDNLERLPEPSACRDLS